MRNKELIEVEELREELKKEKTEAIQKKKLEKCILHLRFSRFFRSAGK